MSYNGEQGNIDFLPWEKYFYCVRGKKAFPTTKYSNFSHFSGPGGKSYILFFAEVLVTRLVLETLSCLKIFKLTLKWQRKLSKLKLSLQKHRPTRQLLYPLRVPFIIMATRREGGCRLSRFHFSFKPLAEGIWYKGEMCNVEDRQVQNSAVFKRLSAKTTGVAERKNFSNWYAPQQPTGICFDMKTLDTVDASTAVQRMTSKVSSLVEYLK